MSLESFSCFEPNYLGPGYQVVVKNTFIDIQFKLPELRRAHSMPILSTVGNIVEEELYDDIFSVSTNIDSIKILEEDNMTSCSYDSNKQDEFIDIIQTAIMLKNIPNDYTQMMLLEMLDENGFKLCYNFVYLPVDFKTGCGRGYAIVNLNDLSIVRMFWNTFNNYTNWKIPSKKICSLVLYNRRNYNELVNRYRNSPIMHKNVPDEYKPVVFENGQPIKFPKNTKQIHKPQDTLYVNSNVHSRQ